MRRVTALALLLLTACNYRPDGPTLHPASGRVRVGGKPVAGVRVRLLARGATPDTPTPFATTRADGSFTLETSGHLGAPEGHWAVMLTWPPTGFGPPGRAAADRLAGRYADADRPFCEATIQPGTNDLGTLDVPEVARSAAPRPHQKGSRP